jgi:hypothetical protein
MKYQLQPRITKGARVEPEGEETCRLLIPSGPAGSYRVAQLDNYGSISRKRFPQQAPFALELRGRVSAAGLPGTWGFGLWNDPFGVGLGMGGAPLRLPALPNAAWFFYASLPNHLALSDAHPAQGFLAATFRAPLVPTAVLALGGPGAVLLAWPAAARLLRRLFARVVREDGVGLDVDVTRWHLFRLEWLEQAARFWVDGRLVFETPVAPRGKLGLVIWIDNQYAAFPPDGRLRSGALANPQEAWLDIQFLPDLN